MCFLVSGFALVAGDTAGRHCDDIELPEIEAALMSRIPFNAGLVGNSRRQADFALGSTESALCEIKVSGPRFGERADHSVVQDARICAN